MNYVLLLRMRLACVQPEQFYDNDDDRGQRGREKNGKFLLNFVMLKTKFMQNFCIKIIR